MLHQACVPSPLPLAGVEVVLVPGKGRSRGMRATTSFKRGDIIVGEEPFAAVAMTDVMDQPVCHNDLMRTRVEEKDLKTCQGCKRTWYEYAVKKHASLDLCSYEFLNVAEEGC